MNKWGQIRKEMGHEEPFNLKYLAIGNEQWGIINPERFERFVTAIRAKHPEIKIVGTASPDPEGDKFDYLWKEMRLLKIGFYHELIVMITMIVLDQKFSQVNMHVMVLVENTTTSMRH